MAQPAGVPGENLIAFPNQNPNPPEQPKEAPASEPNRETDVLRKLRRSRESKPAKTKKRKLRRPFPAQQYIATPTPGSFDRLVPAGDVDESANRSTHYRTADAEAAAIAHHRIHNIWERERDGSDGLEGRLVREHKGLQMIERLKGDAVRARDIAAQYQEQARDGDDAGTLGGRAIAAYKAAHRLETRAAEIEVKVNGLTYLIDGTARRVHNQAAIVRSHFWVEFEQRALADPANIGVWRTKKQQVNAAELRRKFNKLFGAPEIPSVEEIDELIRKTRESFRRPRPGSSDKKQR